MLDKKVVETELINFCLSELNIKNLDSATIDGFIKKCECKSNSATAIVREGVSSADVLTCGNCKHWLERRCEELETEADLDVYDDGVRCNDLLQIFTPEYFGCNLFESK